jgi:hypothetical protein
MFFFITNFMVIKVQTYGNVSPIFRNLTAEILENVSKDMKDFPPQCDLHICKSMEDFESFMKKSYEKLSQITGCSVQEFRKIRGCQSFYDFDFPEIAIAEDFIKPQVNYLEQLEGIVSHEGGHASDFWKTQRLSFYFNPAPIQTYINSTKSEYEAENYAIEAGYYSGILARNVTTIDAMIEEGERATPYSFYKHLALMAHNAAFMQNSKPPQMQKQLMEKLWNKFSESRKSNAARNLVQSKELKESPEKFGDENFLEDFIFEKHHGWGFSFV